MKQAILTALIGAATLSTAAHAVDSGIYAGVGTLGLNLGYKAGITENLGVRVGINTFDYSDTYSDGDVDYKGDLKMQSVELLVDYHPFGNGFSLTAGALYNNNKFEGNARANLSGTIDINDVTYSGSNPAAKVTAKLGDGLTPYVGFGYTANPTAAKGFRFNAGLGVVFQKPNVKVEVSGVNDPSGTLEADRAEAERKLKKDLDDLRNYPVVHIGVSYAF